MNYLKTNLIYKKTNFTSDYLNISWYGFCFQFLFNQPIFTGYSVPPELLQQHFTQVVLYALSINQQTASAH